MYSQAPISFNNFCVLGLIAETLLLYFSCFSQITAFPASRRRTFLPERRLFLPEEFLYANKRNAFNLP